MSKTKNQPFQIRRLAHTTDMGSDKFGLFKKNFEESKELMKNTNMDDKCTHELSGISEGDSKETGLRVRRVPQEGTPALSFNTNIG
jgi:hypothetical protein